MTINLSMKKSKSLVVDKSKSKTKTPRKKTPRKKSPRKKTPRKKSPRKKTPRKKTLTKKTKSMNPKGSPKRSPKKSSPSKSKSHITKLLKNMYPIRSKYDYRTYNDFSASQIRNAENYNEKKKLEKQKRKDAWGKLKLIHYLDEQDIRHTYRTSDDVPDKVYENYLKDDKFLWFKKRQGELLYFKKRKGRWPKSQEDFFGFMDSLKQERENRKRKRINSPRY